MSGVVLLLNHNTPSGLTQKKQCLHDPQCATTLVGDCI